MKRRPRIFYTDSQKALMWERWREGDSLHQIARLFDRAHSSVRNILAETGGIRPAQRCRSRLALTLAEREEISRAVVAGHSVRSIALRLERSPSTVSREIKRNGGQECYRAAQADQAAWDRARRPKREAYAVRVTTRRKPTITEESPTPCPSASGRPRWKIGRCLVTGRVIYSLAVATPKLPRSSSASPVT